jgi:hypothetical protein
MSKLRIKLYDEDSNKKLFDDRGDSQVLKKKMKLMWEKFQ